MKKYPIWFAYSLIGFGLFLLFKSHIPLLSDIDIWPAILMIIGLACLIDSFLANNPQYLMAGTILLGLGIHFHSMEKYSFWPDHWSVYMMIFGIAFIVRSIKTKQGFLIGIGVIILSSMIIMSIMIPHQLKWVYAVIEQLETLWPFFLIILGIYFLTKKR